MQEKIGTRTYLECNENNTIQNVVVCLSPDPPHNPIDCPVIENPESKLRVGSVCEGQLGMESGIEAPSECIPFFTASSTPSEIPVPATSDPTSSTATSNSTGDSVTSISNPASISGNDKSTSSSSSNNTAAIVGGVVGGVLLLLIAVIVAFFLIRRHRQHLDSEKGYTEHQILNEGYRVQQMAGSPKALGDSVSVIP